MSKNESLSDPWFQKTPLRHGIPQSARRLGKFMRKREFAGLNCEIASIASFRIRNENVKKRIPS